MTQSKKVLLFKGQSQYDVLRFFVDDLDRAFQFLGLPTVVVDLLAPDAESSLRRALAENQFLFALGFNGIGQELRIQDQSLYDVFRIPHFSFYVDHPIYHDDRLRYSFQYQITSFVDRDHLDFVDAYYPGKYAVFIPHGGCADPAVRSSPMPLEKRSIPLLFAGSYRDPDAFLKSLGLPPDITRQVHAISEIMLAGGNANIHRATVSFYRSLGIEPDSDFIPVMQIADMHFRLIHRKELILSLSELPLTICGNGWDQLKGAKKPLTVLAAKSFDDTLRLMGDSKIALSIVPYFQNGAHERVFSAMLSGAVAAADQNAHLDQHMSPYEHYIGYRSGEPLADLLASALEDPNGLQSIASNGKRLAERNHTWANRAVEILRAVKDFLQRVQETQTEYSGPSQ